MDTSFQRQLGKFGACEPAVEWVGTKTARESWEACERGDWLLWLASTAEVDRKAVVLAACACAKLALEYVTPGELRPALAIEAAIGWTQGEVEIDVVRSAAHDAHAAAAHAASAPSAAAYAAHAASAPSAAAHAASAAAYAAACAGTGSFDYAASAAAYAQKEMFRQCAVEVRKFITSDMIVEALTGK